MEHQSSGGLASHSPHETVGPYEILSEIGRGGMGVVYKARDPRLDRMVAIKLLPPKMRADQAARKQLQSEARAASGLDHPNICTIHDFGETVDGSLFIAMAYYEGATLERLVSDGPLGPDEAVRIALDIARGVEDAHRAGIVHRDLKPSNVFLTERGDVKILDFGIARRLVAKLSDSGSVRGTPAYMSPEQVLGQRADQRTDLWSIGVLLYEMLSGCRPFGGDYPAAALYSIVNEDPTPLPDSVPQPLRTLVAGLLEKDPERRCGSASELVAALLPCQQPADVTAAQFPKLPDFLNSFIGREEEIEVIEGLLGSCRLLTLTGPGGSGKTRLSLQVAGRVSDGFDGGVCFVELAPISDSGLVLSAIARALAVEESPGSTIAEDVKQFLLTRRTLLVLDNFEHVLEAGQEVSALLKACPDTKALVTSRAALGLGGEQEYQVPPLAVPADNSSNELESAQASSAVQLFVDRAKAADARFDLTELNASDVAQICRELDGLPLAIELAAARTKLFSPKALAARLGRSLDLLKGTGRGRPARHRTLRQAIEWSYDLLDGPTQKFLRRLSCFAGGWTVEAAEAVCDGGCELDGNALDQLAVLAEQSLIRRNEGVEGEPRFELLETIKAFGIERLRAEGEEEGVRSLHAAHFLALAERAAPELTSSDQGLWLDRLESENDNFRAALDWAETSGNVTIGLALGSALWRFWISRRHIREGMARLAMLLERPSTSTDTEARLKAVNGFATLCHYAGETRRACQVLAQSVEVCRSVGDRKSLATLLNNLAWTHSELSEFEVSRPLANEALEVNREVQDKRGIAVALNNLGWVANYEGRYREALDHHEKGLAIRREIGDLRGVAFVLGSVAWAEQYHGNLDRASALLDEAMDILEKLRDEVLIAWIHKNRARVLRDMGDLDGVVDLLQAGLGVEERHNHQFLIGWNRTILGSIMHELGKKDLSRQHLAVAIEFWKRVECPHGLAESLYETGRCELGNDPDLGLRLLRESLEIRVEIGHLLGVAECIETLAAQPSGQHELKRCVLAMSAADRIRQELETPAPARSRVSEEVEVLRSRMTQADFERAWAKGRALALEEAAALFLDRAAKG